MQLAPTSTDRCMSTGPCFSNENIQTLFFNKATGCTQNLNLRMRLLNEPFPQTSKNMYRMYICDIMFGVQTSTVKNAGFGILEHILGNSGFPLYIKLNAGYVPVHNNGSSKSSETPMSQNMDRN